MKETLNIRWFLIIIEYLSDYPVIILVFREIKSLFN